MIKTKKIIVLEDNNILLKIMNIELLSSGFNVLSATNGINGLSLIIREKPDLVLLDLVMPKMGGFEVLAALKKDKSTKKIPVIILSNLGQDSDIAKGVELGATDYCKKGSIDLSELSKKIIKILAQ